MTNLFILALTVLAVDPSAGLPPLKGQPEIDFVVGEEWQAGLVAEADQHPVHYRAEDVPDGAVFLPDIAQLRWCPVEKDIGRHTIRIFAGDGVNEVSQQITLVVHASKDELDSPSPATEASPPASSREEWSSFLLPGIRYGVFAPVGANETGVLHGFSLELALVTWINRAENIGPSHGHLYLRGDLLTSTLAGSPTCFIYAAGFDLSFERNATRSWLIPFFGLEAGGLVHPSFGHSFQVTALAGVHLWTNRNVFVDATGGYLVAPGALERFRGWRGALGANVTFW